MKYLLSLILVVACSLHSFSLEIPMNWKVGETKMFNITSTSFEGEPGSVVADESTTSSITLRVVKDYGDAYGIEIDGVENEFDELISSLQEKLSESDDIDPLPDVAAKLTIDKETGEFDIRNWEEVTERLEKVDEFFAMIEESMNSKIDESGTEEHSEDMKGFARAFGGMFLSIFKTMSESLTTKDGFIGLSVGELAYINLPFGEDFEVGETITETEHFSNSLGVMAEMSADVDRTLTAVEGNVATLECSLAFDEDDFLQSLRKMMVGVFAGFMGEEAAMEKIEEEFAGMSADLHTNLVMKVNTQTGWATEITMKSVTSVTSRDGEVDYSENITTVVVQ